jgi:glycosyltransferase involved in cell wall biosynthesis
MPSWLNALLRNFSPYHPPMSSSRPLTVVQLVPTLESGGVERGTLEVAATLVERGHRSIVISGGGRMVEELAAAGSEHVQWSIGRKNPLTLRFIGKLRRFVRDESVDILHARSRMPAWVAYLAWRGMKGKTRPRFITTMHGLHSVNSYSAIMTKGERVIAVSNAMRDHIIRNYPRADAARIQVIHRGVETSEFPCGWRPSESWREQWHAEYPMLRDRPVLTLPGRITRMKGHHDFIELMDRLRECGMNAAGLIVGGDDPRRAGYARELREGVKKRRPDSIIFTGHRSDIRDIYAISNVIYSLSAKPESFGRTVLESLSIGRPVIGYDHGGVGELLGSLFPAGSIAPGDIDALTERTVQFIEQPPTIPAVTTFTRQEMLDKTIALYESLAR